jgi:hypothetical protein
MFGISGLFHGTPINQRPARVCSACGVDMAPGPGGLRGIVVDATCARCINQGPVRSRRAERDRKFGRK